MISQVPGPGIGNVGVCPHLRRLEVSEGESRRPRRARAGHIKLLEVMVRHLALDARQVTRLIVDGTQVMGPAGDVFDWGVNVNEQGMYVGNAFSDAQLAVGKYKKVLEGLGVDPVVMKRIFGGTHIPDSVLDWAALHGRRLLA